MNKKIFTVSRLNQEVQQLLESQFGTLWLKGEISNFSRPSSGHFYFSLKDSRSQIRCAMFRGSNRYLQFTPGNGDAVLVRGKVSLYSARGDFQLIVEHMEPAGAGKLQAAFEATKRELNEKGWFEQARKQALPDIPKTIGIVTSPTSAALSDALHVLKRRYRHAPVVIYPCATQGAQAAPSIVTAINRANLRKDCDVLLLVRGGGSLEDLWSFNEVSVAEAIKDSVLPIVTGIGHEIDFTISDLVGDLRAPTPSAAAELATPDTSRLENQVIEYTRRLTDTFAQRLSVARSTLQQQVTRLELQHPRRQILEKWQRLDDAEQRLRRASQLLMAKRRHQLQTQITGLTSRSPQSQVSGFQNHVYVLQSRLKTSMTYQQARSHQKLESLLRTLHGVSPMAVLDRGYAIVKSEGKLISNVASLAPGDTIQTTLSNGDIESVVKAIKNSAIKQ